MALPIIHATPPTIEGQITYTPGEWDSDSKYPLKLRKSGNTVTFTGRLERQNRNTYAENFTIVGTLPEGFRPDVTVCFDCTDESSRPGWLYMKPSGEIQIWTAKLGWHAKVTASGTWTLL